MKLQTPIRATEVEDTYNVFKVYVARVLRGSCSLCAGFLLSTSIVSSNTGRLIEMAFPLQAPTETEIIEYCLQSAIQYSSFHAGLTTD